MLAWTYPMTITTTNTTRIREDDTLQLRLKQLPPLPLYPDFLLDKSPHGTDYAVCINYVFCLFDFLPILSTFGQIGSWNPKKALSINKVTHGEDGPKESAGNRTRVVTSILVCTSLLLLCRDFTS